MKQEILNWLKSNRSFDKGLELYMKYGKSLSLKKQLNMQGDIPLIRGMLFEELRKIAEISTEEFNGILAQPLKKALIDIPVETSKNPEPPKLVEISEMVKKAIRLREEFPFLKSPDCPNELKILVADMITAYEQYKLAHEKLFEEMTPEQAFDITKDLVENYIENREIWEELTHYKEKGELLGKHDIFKNLEWIAELEKMESGELIKRKDALYNAITRTKKKITDGDRPDLTSEREESIASKEKEMAEVLRILKSRGIDLTKENNAIQPAGTDAEEQE